jgi:hyaluronoglucosaminidase
MTPKKVHQHVVNELITSAPASPATPVVRAFWNQDWYGKCEKYGPPTTNLSAFDILANANYSRNGAAIFTTGVTNTGLYPYFECKNGAPYTLTHCQALNGGSPQLANLTAHLAKWAKDVAVIAPDPHSEAVVALDWEVWWPSWEENDVGAGALCDPVHGKCNTNVSHVHACKYCKYYLYADVARNLARSAHPSFAPVQIEAVAKAQWEATTLEWLVQTIQLAKSLRPRAVWGFYNMPGESGNATDLSKLWAAVDALFPSIYLSAPSTEAAAHLRVAAPMAAARRIADTFQPPKQIYVYTMMEYSSLNEVPSTIGLLSASDFAIEYKLPGRYGVAGLILYGGSDDGKDAGRCAAVRAAMATFLPAVQNITRERNRCAATHCGGHGLCVDYGPMRCACMGGWRGPACAMRDAPRAP